MTLVAISKAISVMAMWASLYYLLSPVLMSHPIFGWVAILAIIVTHDIW